MVMKTNKIMPYTFFLAFSLEHRRLPRWPSGKESTSQCRRRRFSPWVRKIPWSRKWQLTPIFLPGESHERGVCWAILHMVSKSWT